MVDAGQTGLDELIDLVRIHPDDKVVRHRLADLLYSYATVRQPWASPQLDDRQRILLDKLRVLTTTCPDDEYVAHRLAKAMAKHLWLPDDIVLDSLRALASTFPDHEHIPILLADTLYCYADYDLLDLDGDLRTIMDELRLLVASYPDNGYIAGNMGGVLLLCMRRSEQVDDEYRAILNELRELTTRHSNHTYGQLTEAMFLYVRKLDPGGIDYLDELRGLVDTYPDDEDIYREVARAFQRYLWKSGVVRVGDSCRKSLDLLRHLVATHPDDGRVVRDLAGALVNYTAIINNTETTDQADEDYRAVLDELRHLVRSHDEYGLTVDTEHVPPIYVSSYPDSEIRHSLIMALVNYMIKTDRINAEFRATLDEIRSLFIANPDDKRFARQMAKALEQYAHASAVTSAGIDDELRGVLDELRGLAAAHQGDKRIASSLAGALANYTFQLTVVDDEFRTVLTEVRRLSVTHLRRKRFAQSVANVLVNYMWKSDHIDIEYRAVLDDIRNLSAAHPRHKIVTSKLANALGHYMFDSTTVDDGYRTALAELRAIVSVHANDEEIALHAARALANHTLRLTRIDGEFRAVLDETRGLAAAYPENKDIALELAEALVGCTTKTDTLADEHHQIVDELRHLTATHNDDKDLNSWLIKSLVVTTGRTTGHKTTNTAHQSLAEAAEIFDRFGAETWVTELVSSLSWFGHPPSGYVAALAGARTVSTSLLGADHAFTAALSTALERIGGD